MTPPTPAIVVKDEKAYGSPSHTFRASLRASVATALAIAIPAIAILNGPGKPARGDDKDQSPPRSTAPGQASYQAFVSEIRRTLRRDDERLIGLADQVLAAAKNPDVPQEPLASIELRVRSAEARYQSARLAREAAELALEEYQKVTSVQELADVESEIKLAREELERTRKFVPEANERRNRINALSRQATASNLEMEDKYNALVAIAELTEKKAGFVLEAAEAKKKTLLEFKVRFRSKQLSSEIEKELSDELAKQATWDLEKVKLLKIKQSTERRMLADVDKRILSLVQQAFPIQQAIEEKLGQLVKGGKSDDSLKTSLRDLTNQLESLVDRAEGERAAARFAPLKTRVQRADRPSLRQRIFGP